MNILWPSIAYFWYYGQETGLDNSFKKRNYLFFALLLKAKRVLYIKNSILTNGKLWHQVLSSTIKLYHSCHTYRLFPVCILIWILKELLCEKDFLHWLHLYVFFPSMRLHKFYKKNNLWKRFTTLTALIWLLSSMCPPVAHKINITTKTFVTNTVLVVFFSPVCIFIWCLRWLFCE